MMKMFVGCVLLLVAGARGSENRNFLKSVSRNGLMGEQVLTDASYPERAENKCDRLKAFWASFVSGDVTVAEKIVAPNAIQHNLGVRQGLAGYQELVGARVITRVDSFRCFETDEYTISHSRFGDQICMDVYRWNNGLVAEHWDNCQTEVVTDSNPHTMVDGPTEACCLNETAQNGDIIERFQREVFIGGSSKGMLNYYQPNGDYIQHNQYLNLPDGPASLASLVVELESRGLSMYKSTKFVIGYGNFVLVAALGLDNLFDALSPPMGAAFDLYRLSGGFIVEHWDTVSRISDLDQWANTNGKW
jgi:predicted SnoaL-like aldol condensation-catalyzing enzyme